MTIIWSDGADISELLPSGGAYRLNVLSIPAGANPSGTGVLLIAAAFEGRPGPTLLGGGGVGGVPNLNVRDAITDAVLFTQECLWVDGVGVVPSVRYFTQDSFPLGLIGGVDFFGTSTIPLTGALTNGATITFESITSATTILTGVIVAAIDDVPWPASPDGKEYALLGTALAEGGSHSGTVALDPVRKTDGLYGYAAGVTSDTSGATSFAGAANWTNVIQRFLTYPYCDIKSNIAGSVITSSPQTLTIWAIGTLPANPTTIAWTLTLSGSGIGSIPGLHAQIKIVDSGGNQLQAIPVLTADLPAGGGLRFFGDTVRMNLGAAGINIRATWDSAPPPGVLLKVGWQMVLWCNNDTSESYSAAIGQYTGDLSTAGDLVPYSVSYPTPVFGNMVIFSTNHTPLRAARSFAQVIGD